MSRAIRILGWLLAAPLFGWAASDYAQASCGDYVMLGGGFHDDESHHGMHHEPASAPGAPKCSGPNCQRRVPWPATPQRLPDFKPYDSACHFSADSPAPPQSSTLLVEPALFFAQNVIVPPEPPPRLVR